VVFVRDLISSLDRALSEPVPPPWVDDRGGWTNWINRWSFWEAMTGTLEYEYKSREARLMGSPIGRILLEPVAQPDSERWDDSAGLRDYLVSLEAWSSDPANEMPSDMWHLAALALETGATHE
jgi:hypothetical protein